MHASLSALGGAAACAVALGAMPSRGVSAGAAPRLEWQRLEDLPDARGRKGMYGGVSNGHLLLAGGSNFPVPQREGGTKEFHRDGFGRDLAKGPAEWRGLKSPLPTGLGEGAVVTTEFGVVCVGGQDAKGPVAMVFVLTFDRSSGEVTRKTLPDLPEPAALAAAEWLDGWLYVAGGQGKNGVLRKFWRLEPKRALEAPVESRWETLPAWNGEGRFGCTLTAVSTPAGARLVLAGGIAGPARSTADYLRDVALFDPARGRWTRGTPMPRGAVLGSTVPLPEGRLLLLGGSDGHDFAMMRQLGERYRVPSEVLLYDAGSDRWSSAGAMPLGVVGASVVKAGEQWIVAGGEYSPGLRTPRVYALRVSEQ